MAKMQEVPTDELLSFHDFPAVHNTNQPHSSFQYNVDLRQDDFNVPPPIPGLDNPDDNPAEPAPLKSLWGIEYYQQFFDVDTKDVLDRIIASITPQRDSILKHHLNKKPDLYGPFWISITLIFTIAISGNIASYFQHANDKYHWKYEFHFVSYAATVIYLYVVLLPFAIWALLKWSSDVADLDGLEDGKTPSVLQLICIYGYSVFIYIPVSILLSIQVDYLQWILVITAALVSGLVLLFTLMPALRLSRHKFSLMIGIMLCNVLLAAGFMLYFFHVPKTVQHEIHNQVVNNASTQSV